MKIKKVSTLVYKKTIVITIFLIFYIVPRPGLRSQYNKSTNPR